MAGEDAILEFTSIEQFAKVVRRDLGAGGGTNGLEFETALTDETVISVRHYSENRENVAECELRRKAQVWVTGSE